MGYDVPEDHHGPRPGDLVEAVGIEGDDDNARLVVGRVVPRKGIAPDKWGRDDRRDIPSMVRASEKGIEHRRTPDHLGIPEDRPVSLDDTRPTLPDMQPEAHNIMAGGCVQEGFPRDKTEEWDMRPRPSEEVEPPHPSFTPEPEVGSKETNPKDAVGVRKWRVFTTIPFTIIWELGVAMLEGARKYGRHNYRVAGVRGSVYIDAAMGHLASWWEGEDVDPDTGLSHITKAMASLCVLRDAMIQGKFVDDRPPKTDLGPVRDELQARVAEIFDRIPEAKAAYVEGDQYDRKEGS